jgi:hypothetical protein
MLSVHRDMKAAKAFFRSAKATIGYRPERVITDGHSSYTTAIRSTLGKAVRHRTSAYLNNLLEQDHRGIKGRIRCMRGFKTHDAADRFCREHGELRDLLRSRRHHNQIVSASLRRFRFARDAQVALGIMQKPMIRHVPIENHQNPGAKADRTSVRYKSGASVRLYILGLFATGERVQATQQRAMKHNGDYHRR